jgi:transposase
MNDPTSLSRDELLELLSQQNLQLQQQDAELQSQRERLRNQDIDLQTGQLEIEKLKQESQAWELAYNKLLQQAFRRRSERYLEDPNQLRIDFGDTDAAADAAAGLADAVEDQEQVIPEHKRRRPRRRRDESLPKHLPRYEVTVDINGAQKICVIHGGRTLLPESMWDRTETLEFERPKLRVRVTKYPKYACVGAPECGIASAERPTGLVEGNKYDSSIAAEIITGKYSYHLPLYRLQDYFAGSGWIPSRSTQCNILAQSHFVVAPLLDYFKEQVQGDLAVGTDETRVTLLLPKVIPKLNLSDPKERRIDEVFRAAIEQDKPSINARMWAYRGVTVKLNIFDFTVSRHRDGPELFFADYSGTLLGDCWSGFDTIVVASHGSMVRAACNAHARRKIHDSKAYPADRRYWLRWYQQLYDIEDRGKSMSLEARLELRQTEAKPIFAAMDAWLAEAAERTSNVILPKSDFGKALQYIRNHFEPLQRYLEEPYLPIDNNETEQLMKQVALGRKNWLFAGSIAGGERAAGMLTLASSALRNDLDVWLYVKDVLDQLLAGVTDYQPLLPWNWAADHPEAIRQYRVTERRTRTDRTRSRRARRRRLTGV